MNTQSMSQVSSRRVGRSILALLAGIAVGIVLSSGTDFVLHAMGLVPSIRERWPNYLLVVATSYRSIYGIAAAYLIARLAPNHPMGHALLAGGLGLIASTLGAAAAWKSTAGQHWYPVALALTAMPTAWIGGRLRELQVQSQTKAA
jgi:hypothetical protein